MSSLNIDISVADAFQYSTQLQECDSDLDVTSRAAEIFKTIFALEGVIIEGLVEPFVRRGTCSGPTALTLPVVHAKYPNGAVKFWRQHALTEAEMGVAESLAELVLATLLKLDKSSLPEDQGDELLRELDNKRYEAQMQSERLELVLSSVGIGFWSCELPLDKLFFDPQVKAHFGFSPDEEITINKFFEQLHTADVERVRLAVERAIESGEPYDIEYRVVHDDSTVHWIRAIGARFGGKPDRFDGLTIDISRKKADEVKLEEALDTALRADKLKSEFLANVSHEIRTPLVGLKGMVEFLTETELTQTQQGYIETLNLCFESLQQTVEDVLSLSQIEVGKLNLKLEPCDIILLLEGCQKLFIARTEEKGVTLKLSVSPDLPEQILTDRNRLFQILSNLVSNAVKFTEQGTIWIRAELESEDQLRLEVEDTGCGIPEDRQEELFEPFVQLDSSHSRNHGGTGLGLSIVKHLAELFGGQVKLDSAIDRGSRFTVSLPLRRCEENSVDRTTDRLLPEERLTGHVLIAEDNPVNRRVIESQVKKLGYSVETVENGLQVLEHLKVRRPDLVLMDCQMPEMDGYEATRRLRTLTNQEAHLPVLALTAHALPGEREKCLACGMDDYLTKPIEVQKLDALIQQWLHASGDS